MKVSLWVNVAETGAVGWVELVMWWQLLNKGHINMDHLRIELLQDL
jgi:hypothetical protein